MRKVHRRRRRALFGFLICLAVCAGLWSAAQYSSLRALSPQTVAQTVSGVFAKGDAPYADETLFAQLVDMAKSGQLERTLVYSGSVSAEQIGRVIDAVYETEGILLYETQKVTYQVQPTVRASRVTVHMEPRASALPYRQIAAADTEQSLVQQVAQAVLDGSDQVVLRTDTGWFGERAVGLVSSALANAPTACEVNSFSSAIYPEGGTHQILELKFTFFVDAAQRAVLQEQLEQKVQSMAQAILTGGETSARGLYQAAHDAVVAAGSYDYEACPAPDTELTGAQRISRSAYGLLIEGKSVCSGYAYAYKALCDALGLPCWVMTGTFEGDDHAWNLVQNEGQTLLVDCTFDDAALNPYAYFMLQENDPKCAGYVRTEINLVPWQ